MTTRREVSELLFGQTIFRAQFIEISFVEPSGNRFVDVGDRSVIPEFGTFLCGIETIDLSRADGDVRSVNHIEERRRGPTMYGLSHEGPRRSRQRYHLIDKTHQQVLAGIRFLGIRVHL